MSDYGSTPPPPPPPPPPSGAYGSGVYGTQGAPPPNYLVWAILSTVLCGLGSLISLPFGIASIVFSTQVNSKWAMGDIAGAQDASRKAKLFAIVSVVIGVVGVIIGIVLVAALGLMATPPTGS
jgi:hypothetical protein